MDKANLLGKRKPEDDLETSPILKKQKEQSQFKERVELLETKSDKADSISLKEIVKGLDETPDFIEEVAVPKKTLFVAHFCPQTTEISDIIDFFKDVGQVIRVRLVVDDKGERMDCGFVEFASANEAKKALQKKNGEYLHDCKIFLDVGATYHPPKYCVDHKVWYEEDYFQQESLPIEEDVAAVDGLDKTPDFVEEVLLVANLSPQTTEIVQIIDFFEDVGEVVSVRLIVNDEGKHVGYGFVEFDSAYEAKRALEEKNGEYLHDHKILLMKGFDQTPDFAQAVGTVRNKMLFVTNLSRQTEISHIINFFKDAGEVVHVRLIVDHWGNHVGYGFVEFASAYEAKKALEEKNGEYLHDQKILLMKGLDETPDFLEAVSTVRNKTLFVDNLSREIKRSHIINFFKDVGEVVHVQLSVDNWGILKGCGFVEFASANEAKKALERKNGAYLINRKIFLDVVETAPFPPRPMYCIDHKVWYEDYLRRESLLIEEDAAAVEGLDETPDFVEEAAVRNKTLFVTNLSDNMRMPDIANFFNKVGKVVRVRLIVDHWGEHVGCCFVEFASANEAKKALEEKNNRSIFLKAAEIASPYPFRPKYNLAEKLWYEDSLRQERLDQKKQKVSYEGKKKTFSDDEC